MVATYHVLFGWEDNCGCEDMACIGGINDASHGATGDMRATGWGLGCGAGGLAKRCYLLKGCERV